MERLICLVIGYCFGLFQTGYLYSKAHNVDIKKEGSGNSGSTNVLRVMGVKAGAIVFLGDCFKTVFACLAARLLFASQPDMVGLLVLYAALGAILGHNYPFYMHFNGGKGIACTAGLLVSIDWRLTLICLIVFALIVGATRYVSLGSLVVVTIFLAWMVVFGMMGEYGVRAGLLPEFYGVAAVIAALAFLRHRANLKRLFSGTENKIGVKKK
ncbi:MAG: glycerol-3-phosphate 1-O-acyltransferase PlsY [Hungatella sp.]|jgi:glycerol-3-phosphate acyltransferase PlsY|nr:glycerol-3-phosphate 1-O-acyltransferase PlsY [Hungatella sp.]